MAQVTNSFQSTFQKYMDAKREVAKQTTELKSLRDEPVEVGAYRRLSDSHLSSVMAYRQQLIKTEGKLAEAESHLKVAESKLMEFLELCPGALVETSVSHNSTPFAMTVTLDLGSKEIIVN